MWDSCVFNFGLDDVHCVIIKVIVENAFTESVVLIWVLNNWFLEIDFEVKHLNKRSVTLEFNVLKHSADFAYNK